MPMTGTMTRSPTPTMTDQQLLELERSYWDAMKNRNTRVAAQLTHRDSTIVGASGVTAIDNAAIARLVEQAPYEIRDYRIDPKTTRIVRIGEDAAAISYGVHEEVDVDGKRVKLDAFDSSVWKRQENGWTCILHTESIAGDAFGRDRSKKPLTA